MAKCRPEKGKTLDQIRAERESKRREAAELYLGGMTVREIMKRLDLSVSAVYKYLRAEGIQPRQKHWSHHRESIRGKREQALQLHKQGISGNRIAVMIGVSRSTAQNYLKSLGAQPHPHIASDPDQLERIRALHHDFDWTCKEIAGMLGLSPNTITSRLRDNGLEVRGMEIMAERETERLRPRRERLSHLYEKGETLGFIQYNLGVCEKTLLKDLRHLKAGGLRRSGDWEHPWEKASRQSVEDARHRQLQRAKRIHRKIKGRSRR